MFAEASDRMKELAGVDARAVYGIAGEELAAFGDELDLLVVGSRGYGPLRRLVSGSTTNYLERHARCSLLVLPRADTAPAPEPVTAIEDRDLAVPARREGSRYRHGDEPPGRNPKRRPRR